MAEKELSSLLLSFRNFLRSSWDNLPQQIFSKDDGNEPLNDWLQTNWECLVEYNLGTDLRIEVYGDGADCNDASSRVYDHKALPTHGIYINKDHLFHSFGTLKDDYFVVAPPFDYVKGESESNSHYWVKFDEAKFILKPSY